MLIGVLRDPFQVLEHGQGRIQPRLLPNVREAVASIVDGACVSATYASQIPQQRRLSAAVRTFDLDQRSRIDLQMEVSEQRSLANFNQESRYVEQWRDARLGQFTLKTDYSPV